MFRYYIRLTPTAGSVLNGGQSLLEGYQGRCLSNSCTCLKDTKTGASAIAGEREFHVITMRGGKAVCVVVRSIRLR